MFLLPLLLYFVLFFLVFFCIVFAFFAFFLHFFAFGFVFFVVAFLIYIFSHFLRKNIPLFYRIWLEAVTIILIQLPRPGMPSLGIELDFNSIAKAWNAKSWN